MSQSTRYPNKGNWCDWHPPFEFLPSCYVPNHDDDNDYTRRMPLLSYGIGFNRSDAVEFVRDHNLLTKYEQELDAEGPGEYYDSVMATVDHIIRRAKLPGAQLAYPLFNDYEFVLEMWTNYNMRGVRGLYRDVKTQVKKASEVFGGRPVLWWWTVEQSCSRTGEEWPSSWLYANLVAPEYRERLGQDIWAIWHERFMHLSDVRGLDVDDPELDEEYDDEDDEEGEEEVLVEEEDQEEEEDDDDIDEAVEVNEVRTRDPQ